MSKFAILFLLTYFSGLLWSFIQGAHWAFYVYELVYFLHPEARWWSAGLPFSKYSFTSVVILFLTFLLFNRRNQYFLNKLTNLHIFKWLVLLNITYGLVYFSAVSKEHHLETLIEYTKLFIVMGLAYKVLDSLKKIEYAIYALIVGITYLGYAAYTTGRDDFGRIDAFGMIDGPDVNVAAAAMISSLPFLIFYFWKGSLKTKIAMTFCGALIVNGLVLANSRGAFVGGGIATTYFMWEMYRSKFKVRYQRFAAILLLILGLFSLILVTDTLFLERMATLSDVSDESKSGSHRVRFWLITFDILKKYPFGTGGFGYELLSPYYVPVEYLDAGKSVKAVHSIWFQALSESGYIGFIFFMMIIYITYRSLKQVKRRCQEVNDSYSFYFAHALLSSYIGVLAAASFLNLFRTQFVYFLILFAACLHNIYLTKKQAEP